MFYRILGKTLNTLKKGYPFQLLIHDDCPYCSLPGEVCGGCKYFKSYPDSPIGVCKNARLAKSKK